jgi:hypothetical protein
VYFLIVSLKKTAQVISQIDVTQNLVIVDFVKKDGYPMILRRDTDETPIICELKSMVFDDPLLFARR